jgi:hypothetical protein
LSSKHLNATNSNIIKQKLSTIKNKLECENCNKEYKDRTGLWRHKKTCNVEKGISPDQQKNINNLIEPSDKELIMMVVKQNSELIKENSELKNMMIKILEKEEI